MNKSKIAFALAIPSVLLGGEARAEAPDTPTPAPLTWKEHQEWKPSPVVLPEPVAEMETVPVFSDAAGTALDLVPAPSAPIKSGAEVPLPEPPPTPTPVKVEAVIPAPIVEKPAPVAVKPSPVIKQAPIKVAAAPQKLSIPPSKITQGIEVRRTDNVLPLEKLEPATRDDLYINPGVNPEIRYTDESATVNLRISAKRPLELETRVIEGPAFIGTPGVQQIAVGRDTNIRATVGRGKVVLGLFDSAGKEIGRVNYNIKKEKAIQHSVSLSGNMNENLASDGGEPRYSYSAGYSISPRDGNMNLSFRGSWSPDANRSLGFSLSYRLR